MSSDKDKARLWGVQTSVNKMVLDGTRDAGEVADILQKYVIDPPATGQVSKFDLLVDLGTIVVEHVVSLDTFKVRHQSGKKKSFYFYNDAITDANFSNPSRILKPGDKLRVCAYKQVVGGTTTSEERMAYLKSQRMDVYTGAQGVSLVFDQKRDQLPKGKGYASFDEAEHLLFVDGSHGVPCVGAFSDGGFRFGLGGLEVVWRGGDAFLGFCDENTLAL